MTVNTTVNYAHTSKHVMKLLTIVILVCLTSTTALGARTSNLSLVHMQNAKILKKSPTSLSVRLNCSSPISVTLLLSLNPAELESIKLPTSAFIMEDTINFELGKNIETCQELKKYSNPLDILASVGTFFYKAGCENSYVITKVDRHCRYTPRTRMYGQLFDASNVAKARPQLLTDLVRIRGLQNAVDLNNVKNTMVKIKLPVKEACRLLKKQVSKHSDYIQDLAFFSKNFYMPYFEFRLYPAVVLSDVPFLSEIERVYSRALYDAICRKSYDKMYIYPDFSASTEKKDGKLPWAVLDFEESRVSIIPEALEEYTSEEEIKLLRNWSRLQARAERIPLDMSEPANSSRSIIFKIFEPSMLSILEDHLAIYKNIQDLGIFTSKLLAEKAAIVSVILFSPATRYLASDKTFASLPPKTRILFFVNTIFNEPVAVFQKGSKSFVVAVVDGKPIALFDDHMLSLSKAKTLLKGAKLVYSSKREAFFLKALRQAYLSSSSRKTHP